MKKLLLFFVCVVGLFSCGHKQTQTRETARPVKVTEAKSLSSVSKNYAGVVQADDEVNMAFKISGQVINIPVSTGERVRKGQLLAEMDVRDYQLEYDAAQSAYVTAKAQYERYSRLLEKEAVSKQDYEIAYTKYEQAKAQLDNCANKLSYAKISAPFDATVAEKFVDTWERVNVGQAIIKLVNTDVFYVEFVLSDYSLNELREGHPTFWIRFNSLSDVYYKAKLRQYTDISADGSGIPVTLWVDDPSFKDIVVKPGFSCDVKVDFAFDQEEDTGVAVPITAVFVNPENGEKSVWVVEGEELSLRTIELGSPVGNDCYAVKSGVKAGEKVVSAGAVTLQKGQKVNILQ